MTLKELREHRQYPEQTEVADAGLLRVKRAKPDPRITPLEVDCA